MQSEKRGSALRWCVGMLMACWAAAGGCDTGPKTVVCPCEIRDVIMYDKMCQPGDKPNLSEVPFHFDLGQARTQRIFHGAQYHTGKPRWDSYKGAYYCIAVMEGGAERGLWLSCPGACFWIEGQGGHYVLDGTSREAVDKLQVACLELMWGDYSEWTKRVRESETFVPLRSGGLYGYVGPDGKWLIPPRFDDALPFSEGLAAVRVGDADTGRWGYIDISGTFVIQPRFTGAFWFSKGLASVAEDDSLRGRFEDDYMKVNLRYIDRSGNSVNKPE